MVVLINKVLEFIENKKKILNEKGKGSSPLGSTDKEHEVHIWLNVKFDTSNLPNRNSRCGLKCIPKSKTLSFFSVG